MAFFLRAERWDRGISSYPDPVKEIGLVLPVNDKIKSINTILNIKIGRKITFRPKKFTINVYPRSPASLYIVSYYVKWVKTSLTCPLSAIRHASHAIMTVAIEKLTYSLTLRELQK